MSSAQGDLESFKDAQKSIENVSLPSLLQPAACLAAQRGHYELLDYCIAQGAGFDHYLTQAARLGADTPDMMEVLLKTNWCNIRDSQKAVKDEIRKSGEDKFRGKWLKENVLKADFVQDDATETLEGSSMSDDQEGGAQPSGAKEYTTEQLKRWFGHVKW